MRRVWDFQHDFHHPVNLYFLFLASSSALKWDRLISTDPSFLSVFKHVYLSLGPQEGGWFLGKIFRDSFGSLLNCSALGQLENTCLFTLSLTSSHFCFPGLHPVFVWYWAAAACSLLNSLQVIGESKYSLQPQPKQMKDKTSFQPKQHLLATVGPWQTQMTKWLFSVSHLQRLAHSRHWRLLPCPTPQTA